MDSPEIQNGKGPGSLRQQFASGVIWSVLGNGANNLISFLVFAIIARVVSADLLGVVAFAIALIELGKMINTAGIPQLLVQRATWDEDYASLAFWLNVALATLLTLVVCLLVAPAIDVYYAAGSGAALTVLSASLLLDAMRIVHEAKLKREFKFKNLAARGTAAGILSGLISVGMALSGFGLWALVAQRVVHSLLMTAFTWLAIYWRPQLKWVWGELGGMVANGFRLMAAGLLGTLSNRFPDLLLGIFAGPVATAIYRVGARGHEALVQFIIFPVMGAALSGFSRVSGNMGNAYISVTRFAALLIYPVFFGAAAIAEQFVALVFGPNWASSSLVMTALCLTAGPATLSYMMMPALVSLHRTRAILWINVSVACSIALVCIACITFGPIGVALGLAVRAHLSAGINLYLLKRLVGVQPLALLKAALPPYIAALIMVGAVVFADRVLTVGMSDLIKTLIAVPLGAAIYPLVLWLFWRKYLIGALEEVQETFPKIGPLLDRFLPSKRP